VSELSTLAPSQFTAWFAQAQSLAVSGRLPSRIRKLSTAKPSWFAAQLITSAGQSYEAGDVGLTFSLMSVIKPFLLLYLLEHLGAAQVFQWVDMQPSDQAFNSLKQLQADQGKPRNPMINSGAIALADKLPGRDGTVCCQTLCDWLNQQAQTQLFLDTELLASVRDLGQEQNQALTKELAVSGYVNQPSIALDTYQQICCLSGTVADLARLGTLLTDAAAISSHHRQIVNALMLTCGLYEASTAFAVNIGLPIKSGISGALVAVMPKQGAIATYSPLLDNVGNPTAGLSFIKLLATELHLSLFG
jgi:glutaminase